MSVVNRPPSGSDTPSSEHQTDSLCPDEVFHILQTFRRRETIRYMLDVDGAVKMSDIAEHVSAQEHETSVSKLTSTQRQRVYIPLYQSHLPKLDEAGIIEYNKPRGIVRPADQLELFRPYLEAAASSPSQTESDHGIFGQENTSRKYHVTAIVACVSLLVASAAGMIHLPGTTLGAIVTAMLVLATGLF